VAVKLRTKATLFYAMTAAFALFVTGVSHLLLPPSSEALAAVFGIVSFVICAVFSPAILTCPHCGAWANWRSSGVITPVVGSTCRQCGKDY
jgi:hypothetical protein